MLTSGDIIEVDLGISQGSEAGLTRPAITVTAQRILARSPSVIQIVPLTRTIRGYATEVTIAADDHNALDQDSAAQCQHIRAVATSRIIGAKGNVGSITLAQIRDTLALLMDL